MEGEKFHFSPSIQMPCFRHAVLKGEGEGRGFGGMCSCDNGGIRVGLFGDNEYVMPFPDRIWPQKVTGQP
jgi:hypothetical protein